MNCGDCRERLPSFADGDIAGSVYEEISSHVAVCRACAKELKRLKTLLVSLRKNQDPSMPGGAQVNAQAQSDSPSSGKGFQGWLAAAGSAKISTVIAVVLILVVAVFAMKSRIETSSQVRQAALEKSKAAGVGAPFSREEIVFGEAVPAEEKIVGKKIVVGESRTVEVTYGGTADIFLSLPPSEAVASHLLDLFDQIQVLEHQKIGSDRHVVTIRNNQISMLEQKLQLLGTTEITRRPFRVVDDLVPSGEQGDLLWFVTVRLQESPVS